MMQQFMNDEDNGSAIENIAKIIEESQNSDTSSLKENEIIGNDGEVITLDKDIIE